MRAAHRQHDHLLGLQPLRVLSFGCTGRATFKTVTASDSHSCAIRTDNTITCWGWKRYGRADATVGHLQRPSPQAVVIRAGCATRQHDHLLGLSTKTGGLLHRRARSKPSPQARRIRAGCAPTTRSPAGACSTTGRVGLMHQVDLIKSALSLRICAVSFVPTGRTKPIGDFTGLSTTAGPWHSLSRRRVRHPRIHRLVQQPAAAQPTLQRQPQDTPLPVAQRRTPTTNQTQTPPTRRMTHKKQCSTKPVVIQSPAVNHLMTWKRSNFEWRAWGKQASTEASVGARPVE